VGVSRDEVSRLFANHVDGACDEEARDAREDRGIDHSQPRDPVHLEVRREHATVFAPANAPALVAAMLDEPAGRASGTLDVLDVGCGTGLCGPLIAPYARRLVGIDLSGRMLAQAEARHVYDELVKRELTAYLRECDAAFDVIVSADALVYFGSLVDVAALAAHTLRAGGRFIFTVEELVGAAAEAEYLLSPHGRYSHSRQYLDRVLTDAGLRPEIVGAELRLEAGSPVPGLVVRATKPAG